MSFSLIKLKEQLEEFKIEDTSNKCSCECISCNEDNCEDCEDCNDCQTCVSCNLEDREESLEDYYQDKINEIKEVALNLIQEEKEEQELKQIKECKHYRNNIIIKSDCCKNNYRCIKCHNENKKHKIKYNKIICSQCYFLQNKNNKFCSRCNFSFGNYICNICMIYTNNIKYVKHCQECKKCIEYESLHCKKCNTCYPSNLDHSSSCIIKNKENNCPVCLKELKKDINYLQCGHVLHNTCRNFIEKNLNKCPYCMKYIVEKLEEKEILDDMIGDLQIPDELNKKVTIKCYQCLNTSNIDYNYIAHKCQFCNSYNTYEL
jgi:RING finger/CHY zinc finger protein 1